MTKIQPLVNLKWNNFFATLKKISLTFKIMLLLRNIVDFDMNSYTYKKNSRLHWVKSRQIVLLYQFSWTKSTVIPLSYHFSPPLSFLPPLPYINRVQTAIFHPSLQDEDPLLHPPGRLPRLPRPGPAPTPGWGGGGPGGGGPGGGGPGGGRWSGRR